MRRPTTRWTVITANRVVPASRTESRRRLYGMSKPGIGTDGRSRVNTPSRRIRDVSIGTTAFWYVEAGLRRTGFRRSGPVLSTKVYGACARGFRYRGRAAEAGLGGGPTGAVWVWAGPEVRLHPSTCITLRATTHFVVSCVEHPWVDRVSNYTRNRTAR